MDYALRVYQSRVYHFIIGIVLSSTILILIPNAGNAGQANYSASKAGMIALAKSVAQEMGPKGIRANAIAPGFEAE